MKRRILNGSKRAIRGLLQGALSVLALLAKPRASEHEMAAPPMRILLMDGAHIGDAIIATSLVTVLRSAYPRAEIGCVAGSWAAEVFRNHPAIVAVHLVDHWRLNRSSASLTERVKRFLRMRRVALAEIRERGYDMAIALRPWHPDFLDLAWQAGIPVRVGFQRSLTAPLATILAHYPDDTVRPFQTQGECLAELLKVCGISQSSLMLRRADWSSTNQEVSQEIQKLFHDVAGPARYCVVHIGTGAPAKELPNDFWVSLADTLTEKGFVVFTGYGARETSNVNAILQRVLRADRCINACGMLSWQGFVEALRGAQTVYGVDSSAVHAAAAVGTPVVAVYSGIGGVGRWRPEGESVTVWSNPVPCSPCHLKNGCSHMQCMKGIQPSDILK